MWLVELHRQKLRIFRGTHSIFESTKAFSILKGNKKKGQIPHSQLVIHISLPKTCSVLPSQGFESFPQTVTKMENFLNQTLIAVLISSLIAIRSYRRKSLNFSGAVSGFIVMTAHIAAGSRFVSLLFVSF